MKRKAAIISVVIVLILSFFASCSSIPVKIATAKKGDQTSDIPTSYYLYNAYVQHANLEYRASSQSMDLKTMFEKSATSSIDPSQMIDDQIKDQTTTLFMGIRKFDELGLELTSEEKEAAKSAYDSLVSMFGNEAPVIKIRTQLRMSDTKFREFLAETYKSTALFKRYFAAGGEYEIKDEALKEIFTNEYYRVKHILIKYPTDASGNPIKDTANADYIKAKQKADTVLANAKAGQDFVTLAKDNTEDNPGPEAGTYTYNQGFVSESYGYTFTDNTMDANFYSKAKEMKVGDIGITESQYGWHIMKKYDVNEVADIFNNLKNDLYSNKAGKIQKQLYEEWAKDYEFKFDDKLLNKYTILNLKNVLY